MQFSVAERLVLLNLLPKEGNYVTLKIVRQPIFLGEHGSYAFILDMKHVSYVYHQGRDTKLIKNIQANDADETAEEFLSEVTLKVKVPRAHRFLTGVTG